MLFVLGLLAPSHLAAVPPSDSSREVINSRWVGAPCRLRFPVEIKTGRDRDGWSKSGWIVAPPERGVRAGNTAAILRVADRDLLADGRVDPETQLVAEGWEVQGGLRLRLRFAERPGRAEMTFHGTFGRDLGASDLAAIERWARLDLLEVTFPSEALPPRPAAREPSVPAGPGAPAARSEPPAAYVPAVRVLAASVQPARVRPGEEIALVVNYLLEGPPPGAGFEVVEVRELLAGERRLTTLEDRLTRAAGTYTSTQRLRVPADLAAGVYRFRARIRLAGLESEGEALFAVE